MSQQHRYPLSRKIFPSLLAIVVITSMAWLDLMDWRRRSSKESEVYMKFMANWDTESVAAANGKGLFIRFQNLNEPRVREDTTRIYFRAVYLLYPQPVIVAHEGAVINTTDQLIAANFQPDARWLAERGIGTVLVVDGRYANPTIQPLSKIQPTTAGR
jgi:hypothetical protein